MQAEPARGGTAAESGESGFPAVADRLRRSVEALLRLSAMFELFSTEAQSREVGEAEARLAAPGEEAEAMAASLAGGRQVLAEARAALAAAASPIEDIQRRAKTIGIVAVNARVVAAGMGGAGAGLEVFTTDIAALSDQAGAAARALALQHAGLVDEVRRAQAQHAKVEALHATSLAGLAARIAAPLAIAAQRRREAAGEGKRIGLGLRGFALRAAQAHGALRIGGEVRRRVEAAQGALSAVAGPATAGLASRPALRTTLLDAVCRLQMAQLDAAADALAGEIAAGTVALRALAAEMSDIPTPDRRANSAAEGALTTLKGELRGAAELLLRCGAAITGLDAGRERRDEALRELRERVEAIRTLEGELRLLSLNATLHCAKLGAAGRALNVVAQQLRELTLDTSGPADAAAAFNRALAAGEAARRRSEDKEGRIATAETDASSALGHLRSVERRFDAALAMLAESVPRVAGMVREAADGLAGQSHVIDALGEARRRIAALGRQGSEPEFGAFGEEDRSLARALLAGLRQRCATEDEQRLHDRIVAGFGLESRADHQPVAVRAAS